jgi:anti-sigma B factor antagonist
MSATVNVRYSGAVAIVDVSGRVSLSEGLGVLRDTIRQEINSGYKHVVLNLAGVIYMDSAALAEMASAYIAVSGKGGKLRLANAQQRIQELLRVTRLSSILENYDSEAAALASLGVR